MRRHVRLLVLLAWLVIVAGARAGEPPFTVEITGNPGAETQSAEATFSFRASESADFECALDNQAPEPCGTRATEGTKNYGDLDEGSHLFVVTGREVVAAEPSQTSDKFSWAVVAATTVTETSTTVETRTVRHADRHADRDGHTDGD